MRGGRGRRALSSVVDALVVVERVERAEHLVAETAARRVERLQVLLLRVPLEGEPRRQQLPAHLAAVPRGHCTTRDGALGPRRSRRRAAVAVSCGRGARRRSRRGRGKRRDASLQRIEGGGTGRGGRRLLFAMVDALVVAQAVQARVHPPTNVTDGLARRPHVYVLNVTFEARERGQALVTGLAPVIFRGRAAATWHTTQHVSGRTRSHSALTQCTARRSTSTATRRRRPRLHRPDRPRVGPTPDILTSLSCNRAIYRNCRVTSR